MNTVVELQDVVGADLEEQQNEDVFEEGEKEGVSVAQGLKLFGVFEQADWYFLDGSEAAGAALGLMRVGERFTGFCGLRVGFGELPVCLALIQIYHFIMLVIWLLISFYIILGFIGFSYLSRQFHG